MQEHKLVIMRHAKSDWSEENRSDFDRPLTSRGIKAAKSMGKWLTAHQFHMDRVVCSPALRAKQTCQLVLKELGVSPNNILWEAGIYEASLNDLLSLIRQYRQDTHTLFIIGHNPSLDQLLCYLSKDSPPVNSLGKLLTTGAVAVLNYDTEAITTKPAQARLQHLIRPKEL